MADRWPHLREALLRKQERLGEASALERLSRHPDWEVLGKMLNRKHEGVCRMVMTPGLDQRERDTWVGFALALRVVMRLADVAIDDLRVQHQDSQVEDALAREEWLPPNPHLPPGAKG